MGLLTLKVADLLGRHAVVVHLLTEEAHVISMIVSDGEGVGASHSPLEVVGLLRRQHTPLYPEGLSIALGQKRQAAYVVLQSEVPCALHCLVAMFGCWVVMLSEGSHVLDCPLHALLVQILDGPLVILSVRLIGSPHKLIEMALIVVHRD